MRRTRSFRAPVVVALSALCTPLVAVAAERPFQTALSLLPADVLAVRGLILDEPGDPDRAAQLQLAIDGALQQFAPPMAFPISLKALQPMIGREVLAASRVRNPASFFSTQQRAIDWWLVFDASQPLQSQEDWRKLAVEGITMRPGIDQMLFSSAGDARTVACGGSSRGRVWLSSACDSGTLSKTRSGANIQFEDARPFRAVVDRLYWPERAIEFINIPAIRDLFREPGLRDALRGDAEALARLDAALMASEQATTPIAMLAAVRDGIATSSEYGPSHASLTQLGLQGPTRLAETYDPSYRVGDGSDTPIVLTESISPPELQRRIEPTYPEVAKASKVSGRVILQLVVDRTGAVTETKVLRSTPELDQAAIDAVKQWRYKPAMKDGQPVAVYVTVVVNFKLAGAP